MQFPNIDVVLSKFLLNGSFALYISWEDSIKDWIIRTSTITDNEINLELNKNILIELCLY